MRSYLSTKLWRFIVLPLCFAPLAAFGQSIAVAPSDVKWTFVDDFLRPDFRRYYKVRLGAGYASRGKGRLHYQISKAADGVSVTSDFLGIDRLGRPAVPSTLISLSFSGTAWTLETRIAYQLGQIGNGRSASIWVSFEGPDYRNRNAIRFVRSADLPSSSQSMTASVIENGREVLSQRLATAEELTRSGDDAWVVRIVRGGQRFAVYVANGDHDLHNVLEWSFGEMSGVSIQSLVFGGAAFSDGASFDVKGIRLAGAYPIRNADRPQPCVRTGASVSHLLDVPAEDILSALGAGRDVDLRFVRIVGALDFRFLGQKTPNAANAVGGRWSCEYCVFNGTFLVTNAITFQSTVSFFRSSFAAVALPGATFEKAYSCVGCDFRGDTRFIGTQFRSGADFSFSAFDQRTFFRISHFCHDVSFYGATFRQGADFSSTTFDGDVSLSNLEFQEGRLTFYGSKLGGVVRIVENLEGESQLRGQELNFDRTNLSALVFSAGDRQDPGEQTGPSLTDIDSPVTFRQANIGRFEVFRTKFNKRADFSGAQIGTVKLDDAEFSDLKLDWPVGRVEAPDDTFASIVRSYKDTGDISNERLARWDSYAQRARRGIDANRYCLFCWGRVGFCKLVWVTTGYFTSLARQFFTGMIVVAMFATSVYVPFIFKRVIIRIAKPIELKLRLSETPTLSHGENYMPTYYKPGFWGQVVRVWYSVLFSLMTFAKVGVGNLRVNPKVSSRHKWSKLFTGLVWFVWFLGYAWYFAILYTITGKLPFLGG